MPAIKHSSIRDLKERINIHDVVSSSVSLKRAGSSYKGLSPFNNEKTPSFFISPEKGLYKCFSSGKAGDAISFVMETERLSFTEAVEALAKRFHVELEYEKGGRSQEERSLRQELFDLHDFAASYYRECFLADNEQGKWIREYWLNQRQFDLDTAEAYQIGYAPTSGVELGKQATNKGFSPQCIQESGLFYAKRSLIPEQMGYRFRGRLMIPIRDYQGRVTAFTARQLEVTPQDDPSREAKYVNSPETPIFTKGNLLFNLDKARMEVNEQTPFIMVEGQLDAIRCSSVGLKGVIAPQGTGITESQLRLIKRYEPRLRVILDGDRAGADAALRMLPLALRQGIETTFTSLAEGTDPDDLLRDGGTEAFEELDENQAIAFACHSLAPDPQSLTPQAKAKVAKELFAIIEKAESSTAKKGFVEQIARELQMDVAATQEDFTQFLRGQLSRARPRQKTENNPEPSPAKPVYSAERDLLLVCLHDADIGQRASEVIDDQWIDSSEKEGELLSHVMNEFSHHMWNGPESLNEQLDDAELKSLIASILFEEPELENPSRIANEAIRKLVTKFADKRIQEIKLEIARKEENFNDEVLLLLEESSALQKIKASPPQLEQIYK